ncbi:heterokaryon incompatibility protein-domain-containing protein [Lasiosphaeria hispida]|uniref:Heterokaryon incompatibility protein-domain-containing protein n=1 Tax=Lasiosphaeria hispida TaxID=260671 RepID=A0AAJ0HAI8_9PEZI|nr:heterokaryon incompatibility protein-domain-containing protein [Lasiosphaeria hispida]
MRLLKTGSIELREFTDDQVPPYAILSHTWSAEEITLRDLQENHAVANKKGYEKIKRCCSVAGAKGFEYVWVDTCCIDKTSSAELSEAINSMYRWYEEAGECYAYLADVPSKVEFSKSRWFTRGWTLQELIAPSTVIFFNEDWEALGTKESLRQAISDCTRIPVGILLGEDDLEMFSIAQKMSWAARRETTRVEDRAYCLLGIFGIHMPLIYGEKETAFIRLQEEIMKISDDHSLFAWRSVDNRGGILATSPAAFIDSSSIVEFTPFDAVGNPLTGSERNVPTA